MHLYSYVHKYLVTLYVHKYIVTYVLMYISMYILHTYSICMYTKQMYIILKGYGPNHHLK